MIRLFTTGAAALLAATALIAAPAAAQSQGEPEALGAMAFLEGPAVTEDGVVYFTDLLNNRIWMRAEDGTMSRFRIGSGYANGLAIDDEGRLLAAENGDPAAGTPARITRTDLATGEVTVLVDSFDGKPLGGPNDVTVDGKGRVWFTDWARPGLIPPLDGPAPEEPNPFGVYRIDTDGSVHRVLAAPDIVAPNGLIVTPDDMTLYLVETNSAGDERRRVDAYDIAEDGSLTFSHVFHDFETGRSGDGVAIDTEGRLWVAAGLNALRGTGETLATRAGVYVFSPEGKILHIVPIGEDLVTNVAFGGPDRSIAYITAGKTLYAIPSDVPGTRR